MKKLTVKEIAQMAGVSVTTVSFVLNNKPGVSDTVRQRVQEIIDENHFKPNLNSKKLLKNKSYNICLLINSFSSPFEDLFYFDIARGILNQCSQYGYNLIMSKYLNDTEDLPDIIYSGDVDGVIFLQEISASVMQKVNEIDIPFVVVDALKVMDNITSINPDYSTAAYDATNYLIDQGHRDIVLIANKELDAFFAQIYQGFQKAMADNGLPLYKNQLGISVPGEDEACRAVQTLLAKPEDRPSALLCATDILAIGAIRGAQKVHLSVPNDVSVVGIDDIFLSRYIEPKLTTISVNKEAMGVYAMDLLYKKIKGKTPESISLPMNLVVRDSVKRYNKE